MISRRQFSTGAAIVLGSAITGCLNNNHASPPSIVVSNSSGEEQQVRLVLYGASGEKLKQNTLTLGPSERRKIGNFFPSPGEFEVFGNAIGLGEDTITVDYEADSDGEIRGGFLVMLSINSNRVVDLTKSAA
jgi:hypothetical protein